MFSYTMWLFASLTVASLLVSAFPLEYSTTKREECTADSAHACLDKAGPSADSSDVYGCLFDFAGVCCGSTPFQPPKRRIDVSPIKRDDDPLTAFLASLGIPPPTAPAGKREDSDPFGVLTPCLQSFGVIPGGEGSTSPAASLPAAPSTNNGGSDPVGGTVLAANNMIAPSDKREENSPGTLSAGRTNGDNAAPVIKREDSDDPFGFKAACLAFLGLNDDTATNARKREDSDDPFGFESACLRALASEGGTATPSNKREDDDSFGAPLTSTDDTTTSATKRTDVSLMRREDDDSLVTASPGTDDAVSSARRRASGFTIKREGSQSPVAACLGLISPNQDRKRNIHLSAAKRDDCDLQAAEEICVNQLGPNADCVYLVQCYSNLMQDCSNPDPPEQESKRAELTCNFALIDHTCSNKLGPSATGGAMSKCIHEGFKASPACANNLEFEFPNHNHEDLACNIDSLAKACHTKRSSMSEYFGCVSEMAAFINGCEQQLLAAMDID